MNSALIKILFNPFGRIAGMKAFAIGIVIVAATVMIGYFCETVFAGIASVKFVPGLTLRMAVYVQASSLLLTVAVMYIMSLILAKNVRFSDFLGTITLSRYPFILAAIPVYFINAPETGELMERLSSGNFQPGYISGILIASFIMIIFALWSTVLLFNAYRISSGLKGPRLYGSFAAGVIIVAIISNTALFLLAS